MGIDVQRLPTWRAIGSYAEDPGLHAASDDRLHPGITLLQATLRSQRKTRVVSGQSGNFTVTQLVGDAAHLLADVVAPDTRLESLQLLLEVRTEDLRRDVEARNGGADDRVVSFGSFRGASGLT